MNEDRKTDELTKKAKQVNVPEWATHIAVRTDGSKAEPCLWMEKANDYVDEDPSHIKDGRWVGGYNSRYWVFFSRAEINK